MARPRINPERPLTSAELARASRAKARAEGKRPIEIMLHSDTIAAIDSEARRTGTTRAKVVEDLASGLPRYHDTQA